MSAVKIVKGLTGVEHAGTGFTDRADWAARPRALPQPGGRALVQQVTRSCDAAALVGAYFCSYHLHDVLFSGVYQPMAALREYIWMLWLILPFWLYAMRRARMYEADCYASFATLFKRLFKAQIIGAMLLLSFLFVSRSWNVSRLFTQTFIAVSFVAVVCERSTLKLLTDRTSLSFVAHLPRIVVIGEGAQVESYAAFMRKHSWLVREIIGYLSVHNPAPPARTCHLLGTVDDLAAILNDQVVDEVVIVSPQLVDDGELVRRCLLRGVTVRFVLQAPATSAGTSTAEDLGEGFYQLSISAVPHHPLQLMAKRLMDISGALVGLPLCALAALWYWPRLRRESPGPLLFRQTRVGQNGRRFTLYKFRTMHLDADRRLSELAPYNEMKGQVFKMRNDPRVLPSARIARCYHLDELPQFWNVLRGDMSLVGTRPPTIDEVRRYDFHHHRRISTKPGMTGLSQLAGPRLTDFEDIVRLDCQYIDSWSLWMDIRLLLKTIGKVFEGSAC